MKRLLVLAVTALVAVGLYATTAGGTQQAVTPAQFNALKKQVAKIRKDLNATTTVLAGCVMGGAVPVTRYNGYQAVDSNGAPLQTTALDITNEGDTPAGYALLVNPDPACVNLINGTSLKKLAAFKPLLRGAHLSSAAVRHHR
jgi:hypothetical protein